MAEMVALAAALGIPELLEMGILRQPRQAKAIMVELEQMLAEQAKAVVVVGLRQLGRLQHHLLQEVGMVEQERRLLSLVRL
jgi:hypothetical protein